MAPDAPKLSPERILQLSWGYAPPLILEAAITLGFLDLLDAGPLPVEEVATRTGCSVRGTRGILNALVGFQFLTRGDDDRFALTEEASTFLVRGKPTFYGGFLLHTSRQALPNWMQLKDAVRTGRPPTAANQQESGEAFFQQFVADLLTLNFRAAEVLAAAVLATPPDRPFRVLDIAAGSGVWSLGFVRRSPLVEATALDWEGVLDITRFTAERFGVASQYRFVPGDLRSTSFGEGFDAVILGHILHSEGAAGSCELLKKAFAALRPGGTVVIAEFNPDDDRRGPPLPLLFAVNMLVNTEMGDTFTVAELRTWLEAAGFTDVRTLEAPAPSPLVLARRPVV